MASERSMSAGETGRVTVRADVPPGSVRWNAARLRMAALVFSADRRELLAFGRRMLLGATAVASVLFCILFAILFVLKPLRNLEVVRVVLPPTRTVILKDLVPEPPAPAEPSKPELKQLNVEKVADQPVTEKVVLPPPPTLEPTRPIDPVAARAGRARAREATASLDRATTSLDKALGDLASALGSSSSGSYTPTRHPRDRAVRSGRSDGQLGAVGNGSAGSGASADLAGSTVQGSLVSIGSLASAVTESQPGAEGGAARGPRPGTGRSNASLLAVIQKYAAGIQYCYEAELKRDPSLRGKLVVAMTVTAAGDVAEASVVRNTVGSERLASCALSQIRSWRFPMVSGGLTTFQAPFVFTPPK